MSLENYKDVVLPLRQQAEIRNRRLQERLDSVIPEVMGRNEIGRAHV